MGVEADAGSGHATPRSGSSTSYEFARASPMGAVRARVSFQTGAIRGSGTAGIGIAERIVAVGQASLGSADAAQYLALGLVFSGSASWRIGRNTALALGALLWIDSAGENVEVARNDSTTPFRVLSGTQVLLLPYLGLEFGSH